MACLYWVQGSKGKIAIAGHGCPRTEKEIDHILVRDRKMCKTYPVMRGAEALAMTDHCLVVSLMRVRFQSSNMHRASSRFNVFHFRSDGQLVSKFVETVNSRIPAESDLPNLPEDAWPEEVEGGFRSNNIRAVYKAVKLLSASRSTKMTVPVNKAGGQPVRGTEEALERWSVL